MAKKVVVPFVRSAYNYDPAEASDEAAYVERLPSLTVQAMAEDADINVLMRRYGITGKMPENVRIPTYGDYSGISNYQDALHAVMAADDEFMTIPAEVRARFQNDPQQFLDFCSDPQNIPAMKELGLLKPEVAPAPAEPGPGVPPAVSPPVPQAPAAPAPGKPA